MAGKLNVTPPDLLSCKTLDDYLNIVNAWAKIIDVDEEKKAVMVALNIPEEECKFGTGIRSSLLKAVPLDKLMAKDGLDLLLKHLKEILGEDDTMASINKFREMENFRRKSGQTIENYIADFKRMIESYEAAGSKMTEIHKGWLLLVRANLPEVQEQMVLSGVQVGDDLCKQLEQKMKFVLGKTMKGTSNDDTSSIVNLDKSQQEAMVTRKYQGQKSKYRDFNKKKEDRSKDLPMNPKNKYGKHLTCNDCGSFRHLRAECPYKNKGENKKQKKHKTAFLLDSKESSESSSEEEQVNCLEKVVLYTSKQEEISKFTQEALNSAALDTCCSANVAGEKWMSIYIDSLPEEMRNNVIGPKPVQRKYVFGNQGILDATANYTLPVVIGSDVCTIEVDTIPSDIPLLLSKPEMKSKGMILDMPNDAVLVNGKEISLKTTSAGHYVLYLLPNETEKVRFEEILAVNLKDASLDDIEKALAKLHRQFGHRPKQVFIDLLKSADAWRDDINPILDKLQTGCEGCIKRKRSPDKPAVTLPSANCFNDKVAIDLKIYKKKYILYMIDMYSRYTVATVINRKKPSDVINAIMEKWVAYHGTMRVLLSDNGGEFTGDEMTEVKSMLNIEEQTTAAESPWQNGICERNHAVVDNILQSIDDDYPDMDLGTKLAWACTAKNSMQMIYGYSPFMLVYGQNPKLPNIISDPPPAWESTTMSEQLQKHLEALHATRRAFVKSEMCEKLRIALKRKIRTVDRQYQNGDKVFYKRESQDRWLGPAKVVFQDGKVIFVRQGKYLQRVSANRLLPFEEYLSSEQELPTDPQNSADKTLSPTNSDKITSTNGACTTMDDESEVEQQIPDENLPEAQDQPVIDTNDDHTTNQKPKPKMDIWLFKEGDWKKAKIVSRGGKSSGKFANWWNITYNENNQKDCIDLDSNIWTSENPPENEELMAVSLSKEKRNSPECLKAKEEELRKLKNFETYVEIEDVGQSHISSTWVLTEKKEGIKARLVARGFEESNLEEIRKDSPTMEKSSLRILLTIAVQKGWTVRTTDVTSAFLQGSELEREVIIKPPKEANSEGKLWRLRKCLYGLSDASRMWYLKIEERLKLLNFQQSKMDHGLFFFKREGEIEGIVGLHVDDFFHLGSDFFEKEIMPKVLNGIAVGKCEKESFSYTGFEINQFSDHIVLEQRTYIENMEIPSLDRDVFRDNQRPLNDGERTLLRKMTGMLNWVVRATRPDLSFYLIELSTKFTSGTVADLKQARKLLCDVKNNPAQIIFPKLGKLSDLSLEIFTDAAHRNLNEGEGSTGAYVILISNRSNHKASPLDWQTKKIKRVVHSSLAAEALSLNLGLEAGIAMTILFSEILGKEGKIRILGHCDNQPTCNAIYSTKLVDDKRLRAEIGGIKEMIESKQVWSVDWVKGEGQLADCMTKAGVKGEKLRKVLSTGKLTI